MPRRPRAALNTLLAMSDKLRRSPRLLSRPVNIHLEINDVCNLKCIHCPREDPTIPKQTGHMKIEVIEALRPFFRTAGYVGLIGNGEPFLHPRLLDIVEIVAGEGAVPSIISNATVWNAEKLDRLIAVGPSILILSFDGGTAETFEFIRRPAKFDEVLANMRLLRDRQEAAGSIYPMKNMISCLTRETLPETERVVEIAADVGVSIVHFQTAIPYAEAFRASVLTPDQRDEVLAAVERARVRGQALGVQVHFHSQWDDTRPDSNGHGMYCPNIWEQMHIDMHGNPRFCCYWGPEDLGNVIETPAHRIWNSERFVALRRRFREGDIPTLCTSMPCPNLKPHSSKTIMSEAWRLAKECMANR